MKVIPEPCGPVAELWERWCGVTPWSVMLRQFGELGGEIIYFCGVPRSASAIPLCFILVWNRVELEGYSRLRDLRTALKIAKEVIHENPKT